MLRKRFRIGVLFVAVWSWATLPYAAAPTSVPVPASQPALRNVILISWDGMDRGVLKQRLAASKMPNLAALIKEGSLQDIEVTGHVTDTKPGHAQMLTGLAPQTTGVITNHRFQPIPEGYTLFERVQKQLGKDNVRTIMVASKTGNLGGRGPGEGGDDGTSTKGEPYFLTRKHLDVFDAQTRAAPETCPLFLKYMGLFKAQRFLAFVHFSDPDVEGHAHGSGSKEYRAAAVACDEALGQSVAWLKKEKLYDQTLIYVTADHGFDQNATSHHNAPHVTLATNDKDVAKGGTQADIAPTILEKFGVDLSKLEPKLPGRPLTAPAKKPAALAPTTRPAAAPRAPAPAPAGR